MRDSCDGGYAFPFSFSIAFGFNNHIAMSMNYLHTAKGGGCFAVDFILDFDGHCQELHRPLHIHCTV